MVHGAVERGRARRRAGRGASWCACRKQGPAPTHADETDPLSSLLTLHSGVKQGIARQRAACRAGEAATAAVGGWEQQGPREPAAIPRGLLRVPGNADAPRNGTAGPAEGGAGSQTMLAPQRRCLLAFGAANSIGKAPRHCKRQCQGGGQRFDF